MEQDRSVVTWGQSCLWEGYGGQVGATLHYALGACPQTKSLAGFQ